MTDNQKRILEMLASGKINVNEADRLLAVVNSSETETPNGVLGLGRQGKRAKYLRVQVQPQSDTGSKESPKVNIRVPMALLHAGVKLTSLMPNGVAEKANEAMRKQGIDFDLRNLKPENLEPLVEALSELEVDINDNKETVHIFVE